MGEIINAEQAFKVKDWTDRAIANKLWFIGWDALSNGISIDMKNPLNIAVFKEAEKRHLS